MKYIFENRNGEEMEFTLPTKITPRMNIAIKKILLESMQYWDDSMELPELVITQDENGNCQEMMEMIFRNQQAHLVDWMEQDFDLVLEVLQGFFFSSPPKKKKSLKYSKNLD